MKNKILRFILLPFISIFIGVNFYSWNSANLVGNKLPMPFGYGASVVLSGSMEPRLSVNDLIIVKETSDYSVNDVVVFQDGNTLIVHRIVDIEEENVLTQGDANNVADERINVKQIKGEVVGIVPKIGILINAVKSPLGIILILGSSFVLLEMSYRTDKKEDVNEIQLLKEEISRLKKERDME